MFSKRIENIDPDPSWQYPELPKSLPDWLINREKTDDIVLDPKTVGKLSDAWYSSLEEAHTSRRKISKKRYLGSTTDIVGHIINLNVCLEGSLNRHLFFLRESQQLENEYYAIMDHSELMSKLLFCFKEQILAKTLHINMIKKLVLMRNKAVHYRVDSPESLQPSVEQLIGIWRQLSQIFDLTHGEPSQNDVQELADNFIAKWIV